MHVFHRVGPTSKKVRLKRCIWGCVIIILKHACSLVNSTSDREVHHGNRRDFKMDSHGVSMHNLDLTAAWFRLLYRCLSRSTALAILAFTTLGAIVTCIALVTHWFSVFIIASQTSSIRAHCVISLVPRHWSIYIWNVLYENGSCGFHFIT